MQKLATILLSSLVLLQSFNVQVNDFLNFDELIEHYKFHNEAYGDTFLVFVSKHYGELKAEHSQKHQEEQSDHEKLPFQHIGNASSTLEFVLVSSFLTDTIFDISPSNQSNFYYKVSYSFHFSNGLLQPPKYS